jgi:hypothetical protein
VSGSLRGAFGSSGRTEDGVLLRNIEHRAVCARKSVLGCAAGIITLLLWIQPAGTARPADDASQDVLPLRTHREAPDQPPAQVLPPRRVSPPLAPDRLRRGPFVSVQVNVDDDGNNIVGDAANEPSIAVDPRDPNRIVIGWRQFDTVASSFRQAGWAWSDSAGRRWRFPGVLEPGVFRSDPALDADLDGNFYFLSLTDAFTCDLFKSTDGGRSWLPRVPAFGGDKNWLAIDRTAGIGSGNIYGGRFAARGARGNTGAPPKRQAGSAEPIRARC